MIKKNEKHHILKSHHHSLFHKKNYKFIYFERDLRYITLKQNYEKIFTIMLFI